MSALPLKADTLIERSRRSRRGYCLGGSPARGASQASYNAYAKPNGAGTGVLRQISTLGRTEGSRRCGPRSNLDAALHASHSSGSLEVLPSAVTLHGVILQYPGN
jgi:hypothetical protein